MVELKDYRGTQIEKGFDINKGGPGSGRYERHKKSFGDHVESKGRFIPTKLIDRVKDAENKSKTAFKTDKDSDHEAAALAHDKAHEGYDNLGSNSSGVRSAKLFHSSASESHLLRIREKGEMGEATWKKKFGNAFGIYK